MDKTLHIYLHEIKVEKPVPEPTIDPDDLATFKINAESEELVARNAMVLPFEKSDVPKVIYHAEDDYDDEDPDEDLYI